MVRMGWLVAGVLGWASVAAAQGPEGVFEVRGQLRDGTRYTGSVRVKADDEGYRVTRSLDAEVGPVAFAGGVEAGNGRVRFEGGIETSQVETDGLTGALQGAEDRGTLQAGTQGGWALDVQGEGAQWEARVSEGDEVVARERWVAHQGALLVHADTYTESHVNAFHYYANQLATYYRGQGYTKIDMILGTSMQVVIDKLESAESRGFLYDRVVFIGHGGWDGPVLGEYSSGLARQASAHENPAVFARLVQAIRQGTTEDAGIFASACHAGGSNRYERAREYNNDYVWSNDLAARTGRTVAGPAGYTSTEYTYQHVLATLEGEGVTVQEVAWANGTETRTIRSRRSLDSAPAGPAPVADGELPEPWVETPEEATDEAAVEIGGALGE